ncbi:replication protein P [Piscirickettsia litoralis]|uniref:replication protein P n=1 Tax=Piscirickettsia litoralis TaxID=1891921 RepID=UPI001EEEFCAE|nr:replication protein P [Piscirickettsia litoralis]
MYEKKENNSDAAAPSPKSLYLFAQFDLIFGALWERQHYQDQNKLKTYIEKWNNVLEDIPQRYIEVACEKMSMMPREELRWIPRFGDFLRLCSQVRPQELGFLSTRLAYAEAYALVKQPQKFPNRRWSHPVVFATATTLFNKETPNHSINKSEYAIFRTLYIENIKRFLNGESFPNPTIVQRSLSHKAKRSTTLGNSHLSKLKAKFSKA